MLSFVIILLLALCLVAFIWFLHRNQRRRTRESADRTAPLPVLDDVELDDLAGALPTHAHPLSTDFATSASAPSSVQDAPSIAAEAKPPRAKRRSEAGETTDSNVTAPWLTRIKELREARQLSQALQLCKTYYPRMQALQQAVIILRQQMRLQLEAGQSADAVLEEMHQTAALADLFRNSNPYKPADPEAALRALAMQACEFPYASIGYRRLKLLSKSDMRAMEQLWGRPASHRHTEEILGSEWIRLCGSSGELQS